MSPIKIITKQIDTIKLATLSLSPCSLPGGERDAGSLHEFRSNEHLLFVLPEAKSLAQIADLPLKEVLQARMKRRDSKPDTLKKTPLSADLASGARATWIMLADKDSAFDRQTALRKAVTALLDEQPRSITIVVTGTPEQRQCNAELAIYVALLNGAQLPQRKKKDTRKPLRKITLIGHVSPDDFLLQRAQAEGNTLARELTMLPANDLTPRLYRERIRDLAKAEGWKVEEYDLKKLRKMGAGAFVAVAQGSAEEDAAIVHLSLRHADAKQTIALVGKGICFDTGGHNLKPARYMHGMHEDMNGSAVALGVALAASRAGLPVNLDIWLALAQNHISPAAYKQNDVVTALNGTTIEIIHTDAEGRMVLADTLTLASRQKPDLLIDFATLTGSMASALGARYSGIFSNREKQLDLALAAGKTSGERVSAFPLDADYEEALDSQIADIKQCTMEGDADHILAARFLLRFIENDPAWIHMDLSASNCKGGLGAVASDVNGFGVGWGMALLSLA
ncbi:MAG: leucyl aminopeptidase family protein [Sulfuricellaceae bacterium]|nr:leucyl aminopeptidase family protein [Sulfuricellaceae bacterium]